MTRSRLLLAAQAFVLTQTRAGCAGSGADPPQSTAHYRQNAPGGIATHAVTAAAVDWPGVQQQALAMPGATATLVGTRTTLTDALA
jgi:hypothetical protein